MHRFSLDNSRPTKLFRCPQCGKKTFKRYLDNQQNEYLGEHVGRCNREVNCGYHFKPREYFKDTPAALPEDIKRSNSLLKHLPPGLRYTKAVCSVRGTRAVQREQTPNSTNAPTLSSIPFAVFKSTLGHYDKNNFITWLQNLLGPAITQQLVNKYYIGTSKHLGASTIFWQVDAEGTVRSGKVMYYNTATGKRSKSFSWAHTLLQLPAFELRQCMFGLHLLNHDTGKTIAIVEGEKTAIIASAYLPEFTWMACGGLSQLSLEKMQPLKHRKIVLYPDLVKPNAKDEWTAICAQLLQQGFDIRINKILETIATPDDRTNGLDIADYLIRLKNEERNDKYKPIIEPAAVEPLKQMIAKNPALQTMMDKLGIVRVSVV